MHRVVTLNTLCGIASIYFATQQPVFFRATHFLRGKRCNFELINYFIFRKVLRNVFSDEVGKLTIYQRQVPLGCSVPKIIKIG